MARMNCKCGEVLTNTLSPNDIELVVYTDKEWEEIMSVDNINTWEINIPENSVWRCPKCERIYVFKKGCNKAFKVYKLEDNNN